MKNIIILSAFILSSCAMYSQSDTIFMKSGAIVPVYKVEGYMNDEPYLRFTPVAGAKEQRIDTIVVAGYTTSRTPPEAKKEVKVPNPVMRRSLEDAYYNLNKDKSESDYKIGWVQRNIGKFYKEERTSQLFYGLGVLSGIGGFIKTDTPIFAIMSAGFGLTGLVLHLDSYKWLKRASLETSLNKVAITIGL